MTDETRNDAQAIIDVAQQAAKPEPITPGPSLVYSTIVPQGARHELIDLERYLDEPRRKTGQYKVADVQSLIGYGKEHLDIDHTTVWVHQDSGRVVAVLNDNAVATPAWADHRVVLQLVHTDEWNRWMSLDGKLVDQETFAEHIEESQIDVVQPDAADLLEIAQTFHATTTSSFKSAKRISSGEIQFEYVEDINARAGRGAELSIPTEITLGIPVFLGEQVVQLTALLRYRVREGHLKIGYKLVRPSDVVREAIDAVAAQLRGEFPRVFLGEPA